MTDGVAGPAQQQSFAASGAYRDLTALTQWVTALFGLALLVDVIATVSGLFEFRMLSAIADGTLEGDVYAQAGASDARQQAIGLTQFGLFVLGGIVYLIWVHRANCNARVFGANGMRFTPGWAVGWYFVPVAGLWKPFQAMREIWQASTLPADWQRVQTPPLLGWWWAVYLATAASGQIAYRLTKAIDGLPSAMTASAFTTASDISSIALDILVILLVRQIAATQAEQVRLTGLAKVF